MVELSPSSNQGELAIPIMQMRTMRFREVKKLVHTCTHHQPAAKPRWERVLFCPFYQAAVGGHWGGRDFRPWAIIHRLIKAKAVYTDNEITGPFGAKEEKKCFFKKSVLPWHWLSCDLLRGSEAPHPSRSYFWARVAAPRGEERSHQGWL